MLPHLSNFVGSIPGFFEELPIPSLQLDRPSTRTPVHPQDPSQTSSPPVWLLPLDFPKSISLG